MTEKDKSFDQDALAAILDRNPNIDRATLDRSREVEHQLSAVGIKLGGYRLEPALGGTAVPPCTQPLTSRANR
ncbi:MAG: hypothetical protein F4Y47_17620 [Acidobacteriia bacterium]|nr:hypothetical protein [Terriglobia bacterium]MYK09671.1 hypothetical protein [Terriglobia bacterium]